MTIAAIATANAVGGIGIIRISGPRAIEVAEKIFIGTPVTKMLSHTMHLGKIKYNGKIIDEVLVCVFKAPNSYTGEDVVEINCHGGIYVCRLILDSVIANGARPAEPGEFTRRAFLNGRLDLTQAEAVADLISAQTSDAAVVAANQLDKALSNKIFTVREALVASTAHLLATIDFSEEGVEDLPYDDLLDKMQFAKDEVLSLLNTADDGRIIKDGVNTAIIGAPNVGKSSLLNAISGEDRAIVTDIAGTTRDVLETQINLRGCKLNLFDTAGIRESDDVVEKLGVERSKKALETADLIFLVIDGSRGLLKQDMDVLSLADNSKTICLINKCDLGQQKLDLPDFMHTIRVSAVTGQGLYELFSFIPQKFNVGEITSKVIITNPRHRECLIRANSLIEGIIADMESKAPFDIVLGDIEVTISTLGEISGMTVSDEIIDNIFANFCVGK